MTMVHLRLAPAAGAAVWEVTDLEGDREPTQARLTMDSYGRLKVGHNTALFADATWKGDHWEFNRRVPESEAQEWLRKQTPPTSTPPSEPSTTSRKTELPGKPFSTDS